MIVIQEKRVTGLLLQSCEQASVAHETKEALFHVWVSLFVAGACSVHLSTGH